MLTPFPHPIHAHKLDDLFSKKKCKIGSRNVSIKDLAIVEEELHCFEQEQGFHIYTENDYPSELKIAVEVWDKVFAYGLKPQHPPKSEREIVKDALKPYNLQDSKIKRICYIIIAKKSRSKVTEPTTSEHTRNEQGHPCHAALLKIAVDLWEACKGFTPYKEKAKAWLKLFHEDLKGNELDQILELTNPNPTGGRPKKGV